jgi:hypothetical protein
MVILFNIIVYRGADESLARPTSRCTLFDGENIYFDASLVYKLKIKNWTNCIQDRKNWKLYVQKAKTFK